MNCQKIVDEFLSEYVEQKLSFGERLILRLHLLHCPPCRRYLDSYRRTLALAKTHGADTPPPKPSDLPDELVKAIIAARRPRE